MGCGEGGRDAEAMAWLREPGVLVVSYALLAAGDPVRSARLLSARFEAFAGRARAFSGRRSQVGRGLGAGVVAGVPGVRVFLDARGTPVRARPGWAQLETLVASALLAVVLVPERSHLPAGSARTGARLLALA